MSETRKIKGVWICSAGCGNVELREREVVCWKCYKGEMNYYELKNGPVLAYDAGRAAQDCCDYHRDGGNGPTCMGVPNPKAAQPATTPGQCPTCQSATPLKFPVGMNTLNWKCTDPWHASPSLRTEPAIPALLTGFSVITKRASDAEAEANRLREALRQIIEDIDQTNGGEGAKLPFTLHIRRLAEEALAATKETL